jgi:N-formylmaleamate deformylase
VSDVPAGYVVTVDPGDRIHFVDWGGPDAGRPGVFLVHGLSQTAAIWAPIARSLAADVRTVAMDLRGHGLSDAPTDDGAYDLDILAADVVAVTEGAGLVDKPADGIVLVGHGFGAIVAAVAAPTLADRCRGVVLVDGGWESMEASLGVDPDEFLRGLDEPPEVMRSMPAFLADRKGFDPATWDVDQEATARATVVETHAGRVVPSTRPHALEASVRSMFTYDPARALASVPAPIIALLASDDADRSRSRALATVSERRVRAGLSAIRIVDVGPVGHNLMRYRPSEVLAAIRSMAGTRPAVA